MTQTHWIKTYCIIGAAFYFLFFDVSQFLLILFLSWVLSGIVVSVIYHRQLAHRQFEYSNKFWQYLSYFLIVIVGQGSPISWAAVHRRHHSVTDEDGDPQSPHVVGRVRTLLSWYTMDHVSPKQTIDLIKNTELMFLHRYIGILFAAWCLVVWIFTTAGTALAITALLPLLSSLWSGWVNTFAHDDFTQQQNTMAKNIQPAWLFWGESYHKNHHINPTQTAFGPCDLGLWVVNHIAKSNHL
jgi:stearoyl-CoA desaturase (delta-9 desaturase)